MAKRVIKDTLWGDNRQLAVLDTEGRDEIVIAVQDENGLEGGVGFGGPAARGSFPVRELLEAIYEMAPEFAPDSWEPTPEWHSARVIEGTGCDGGRRVLVRAYAGDDERTWVTDAAIYWSQRATQNALSDIKVLVPGDDD